MAHRFRVLVLISGRGSNLAALIHACQCGEVAADIVAVFSNEPDAAGLGLAAKAGITTQVIAHRDYPSREEFDGALLAAIDRHCPDLVVLAGFMRILSAGFVNHFAGRMINIHPSLLPRFPGLDTHRRALAAGDTTHGATVHFVTPSLDAGPTIAQARVPVLPDDDEERLARRVRNEEHRLLPRVVGWLAAGRLTLDEETVLHDGQPLRPGADLTAAVTEPPAAIKVWVYKGSRRLETYVYLGEEDGFEALPAELREAMGQLELVMDLDVYPGRKLARASAETVIQSIAERGFYLQLPPLDRPGERRVH